MGSVGDDSDYIPSEKLSPEDWYFDVLSWHMMMATARRLTIGRGVTVPPEFVRRQGRALFLGALYRVVPGITDDLLTPELDWLTDSAATARRRWHDETGGISGGDDEAWQAAKESPLYQELKQANKAITDFIKAWQVRHNLTGDWLWDAADETIRIAKEAGPYYGIQIPSPVPLILGEDDIYTDAHSDKRLFGYRNEAATPGLTPEHKQIQVPVYLDQLKHPPVQNGDRELEDDGWFGAFDPRTEDIEDATNRLLEKLRPRVRCALDAIVTEDRELNGAQLRVTYRSMAAFEWLVRYQVRRESMRAIARVEGKDPGHVTREIHKAKDLIGLTLRPPTKGGRPSRKHALTVKPLR